MAKFIQSVQSLVRVWLFATPWTAARQASLSITNSRSLLKLMSIESVVPSRHLILCRHLLLLPPIPPSIRVFSNESVLRMRWPKYWSFNFSISPSNEHPGLISFRMDWLDLLAVQRTLKTLLQHHSSEVSILRCSAFLTFQLSHPHMTTGKTIALTSHVTWTQIPIFWFLCRDYFFHPKSKDISDLTCSKNKLLLPIFDSPVCLMVQLFTLGSSFFIFWGVFFSNLKSYRQVAKRVQSSHTSFTQFCFMLTYIITCNDQNGDTVLCYYLLKYISYSNLADFLLISFLSIIPYCVHFPCIFSSLQSVTVSPSLLVFYGLDTVAESWLVNL